MKSIKKIDRRDWDYILYKVDGKMVITVIFFGQIDYPRSFYLTDNELSQGISQMPYLSEKIRNNYDTYKDREIFPPITREN
jgi:hypothetical protein